MKSGGPQPRTHGHGTSPLQMESDLCRITVILGSVMGRLGLEAQLSTSGSVVWGQEMALSGSQCPCVSSGLVTGSAL